MGLSSNYRKKAKMTVSMVHYWSDAAFLTEGRGNIAWKTVSFKIINFGTRIWLFEVPWVSFYFNGRLKITIIPKRLDKRFCCMVNMLQFWPNSNGVEVRSLLIDVYAVPGCSTPCPFSNTLFDLSLKLALRVVSENINSVNSEGDIPASISELQH